MSQIRGEGYAISVPGGIIGSWCAMRYKDMRRSRKTLFIVGFSLLGVGAGLWVIAIMVTLLAFDNLWNPAFISLLFVGLGFLIPGGICFGIAYRWHRNEKELNDISDLLRAYRRMKITKLSKKMGISEMEAEKKVSRCIEYNLFHGYIDRRTEEVFSMEGLMQERNIKNCSHCGSPVENIVLVGEELHCGACDSIV